VQADLDTLVTALYVTIDDLFGLRHDPGRTVTSRRASRSMNSST
jgi:hypothetical protein